MSSLGYDQRSGTRTGGQGPGRSRVQCQLCGKFGHLVDRCWHRYNKDFLCVAAVNYGSHQSDHKAASSTYNSTILSSDVGCECCTKRKSGSVVIGQLQAHVTSMTSERWVVDSGSTHHVTSDSNKVLNSFEFLSPSKLLVDNGMPLDVALVGHSHVHASSRMLLLNDLCCVCDEATGNVLLQGEEHRGLYSFAMDNNSLAVNLAEGPPHVESNGFRFYVSFMDVFTRHTWIYLLKRKDEAVLVFQMFQKLVVNQFGSTIKALQTDWGAQASLLIKYWSYAAISVVYLINRLPTKVLQGLSPFEKLYEKKPNCSMMKYSHDAPNTVVQPTVNGAVDCASNDVVSGSVVPVDSNGVDTGADHDEFDNVAGAYAGASRDESEIVGIDTTVVTEPSIDVSSSRIHPIMTRSRCGIFKPKVFSSVVDDDVPATINAALQSSHSTVVVHEEYNTLQNNGTWSLVQLPEDRTAVGDMFSSVVRFSMISTVLSIVVSNGWELRHVDINNLFLNGDLSEDVYMQQPPRFE
ncbi:uncharacterized protein LOC120216513 [Hibiscus syriacus]|uniref:uncharacterized protein LOC120216513 n=1 Tax=Hibiscus syriacus TaxID=106335 RepID=UPI001924E8D9|nr:uncharacterized protein LOC120216513 [Hibiscus syriacus]